jgi:hypothetical protein
MTELRAAGDGSASVGQIADCLDFERVNSSIAIEMTHLNFLEYPII